MYVCVYMYIDVSFDSTFLCREYDYANTVERNSTDDLNLSKQIELSPREIFSLSFADFAISLESLEFFFLTRVYWWCHDYISRTNINFVRLNSRSLAEVKFVKISRSEISNAR